MCERRDACIVHPFGATFHAWLGSSVNSYLLRLVQYPLFALHGSGVCFLSWTRTLSSLADLQIALLGLFQEIWAHLHLLDFPNSLQRMHVDWILCRSAQPIEVYVGDTDRKQMSSDHFPVVSVFDLASLPVF